MTLRPPLAASLAALFLLATAPTAQRAARYPRPATDPCLTPSFQGLGDLTGGAFLSIPRGISPDGSFIVGSSQSSRGKEAFVWTEAGGIQPLGDLTGGAFDSEAKAVTSYGTAIVGYGADAAGMMAFRWTPANGMQPLGDLPGGSSFSIAVDVSASGERICGYSSSGNGTEAFAWDQGGSGLQGLGDLPGGVFACRALGISAYGNRIVGDAVDSIGARAVYWDVGAAPVGLPGNGGYRPFAAFGTNNDGNVVVGTTEEFGSPPEAFRWNGSATQNLGLMPYQTLGALGTSATGRRLVGSGWDGQGTRAWMWDPDNGVRDLKEVIEIAYGIDIGAWELEACTDISGDGQRIIGYGQNPAGRREAFVAVLPVAMRADLNRDGVIDLADVGNFAQAFAQGRPRADFNGDGFIDDLDVATYLRAYRDGC